LGGGLFSPQVPITGGKPKKKILWNAGNGAKSHIQIPRGGRKYDTSEEEKPKKGTGENELERCSPTGYSQGENHLKGVQRPEKMTHGGGSQTGKEYLKGHIMRTLRKRRGTCSSHGE